jgi:hypothetical protein
MTELIVEYDKKVTITAIYQWHTYNGLIEGLPTDWANNRILQRLPSNIKSHSGKDVFHIIEPTLTPISYEGNYPFGQPIKLPSVICIADLILWEPVKDPDKQGSALVIAWFQDYFAFPIAPDIIEKLKVVEWSKLAVDFDN